MQRIARVAFRPGMVCKPPVKSSSANMLAGAAASRPQHKTQLCVQSIPSSATLTVAQQIAVAKEEIAQLSVILEQFPLKAQQMSDMVQELSAMEQGFGQPVPMLGMLHHLAWSELLDACMAKARADAKQPASPDDEGAVPVADWAPQAVAARMLGNLTLEDLVTVWGDEEGNLCDSRPPARYFATSIHDQRDAVLGMAADPTFPSLVRIFRYVHGEDVGTAAEALLSRVDADAIRVAAWKTFTAAVNDAEAAGADKGAVESLTDVDSAAP